MRDDVVVSVHPDDEEFLDYDEEVVEPVELPGEGMTRNRDGVLSAENEIVDQVLMSVPPAVAMGTQPVDINLLHSDPTFKEMLSQVVTEHLKRSEETAATSKDPQSSNKSKQIAQDLGNCCRNNGVSQLVQEYGSKNGCVTSMTSGNLCTPVRATDARNAVEVNNADRVKSPLDTTIYAPALAKQKPRSAGSVGRSLVDQDTINKISEFVDRIRLDTGPAETVQGDIRQVINGVVAGPSNMDGHVNNGNGEGSQMVEDVPRGIAEQMILDAERFRATIDKPAGRFQDSLNRNVNHDNVVYPTCTIDDEFFHITFHVDQSLKAKIEWGEYVDLEKLLPKDPTRSWWGKPGWS